MKFYKKYFALAFSLFLISSLFISCKKEKKSDDSQTGITITDIDGNTYHTVKIGTQIWMVENLKTTRYRNGDPIPHVEDSIAWHNMTTPAYCSYNNNAANTATYGYLYNWYTVNDSRNIAPEGWRVATYEDYITLRDFLGGTNKSGGKLKSTGTTHWLSPNKEATNESGFTGFPGGYRRSFIGKATYRLMGENGYWWTSTMPATTTLSPWYVSLDYNNTTFSLSWNSIPSHYGLSVRCIKN